MEKITTVGIDLAKSVFSVHGVDAQGHAMLHKTVRRDKLLELVASLPPCLVGMEARGGAHEWARQFQRGRRHRRQERPHHLGAPR
jgi:transposase